MIKLEAEITIDGEPVRAEAAGVMGSELYEMLALLALIFATIIATVIFGYVFYATILFFLFWGGRYL